MAYTDIISISQLLDFFHYEKPKHPLIAVVDLSKVDRSHRQPGAAYRLDLYSIACKKVDGPFKYGRTTYDFSEGSLMFTAPNQVLSPWIENKVEGWAIYIHPDFLHANSGSSKFLWRYQISLQHHCWLSHVHLKLIDKAKDMLWGTDIPISSIAYDLGFEHPSHFTKLFKSKTGYSPREYRNLN